MALNPKVPFGKRVTRAGFQIPFKSLSQFESFESRVERELPRQIFCGMRTYARIVVMQPLFEI